ncbi:MAG: hypothetical protein JWR04_1306 [Rhodoglobus sp.]|nr:hypothetical protein [Rhodoglobus sp.]
MVDERYDPAFQRGFEPVVEPVETRGRNPWLIVLWVLAVVFTAAGAAALYYSTLALSSPNLDNTVTFYVVPQLLQAVAPWLVGVGLATLSGVVFVHAVQWRR